MPSSVILGETGDIYIADTKNSCIRLLTVSTGVITTVAGGGNFGYSGDGGQAMSASFFFPRLGVHA